MIYLVGGPPRVGKSTVADIAMSEGGIPHCSTDMLVGMLEMAAPQLGVRHGFHADKSESVASLMIAFISSADEGNESYLIEGDVITPSLVSAVRSVVSSVRCVFIGNSALTVDDLRLFLDWLEGCSDAEYERTRREIVERSALLGAECGRTGLNYVDMANGWTKGLAEDLTALELKDLPIEDPRSA